MLIALRTLQRKYRLAVEGVLHVGAHHGEEADDYDRAGYAPVYWVEADEDSIPGLMKTVHDRVHHHVVHAVVADEPRVVAFNRASNGQSSSILEFGTHSREHPDVVFIGRQRLLATTIDELAQRGLIGRANFMNLDIQGAELLALRGGTQYLSGVDYIYSEVNERELYRGCCLLTEFDDWLGVRGFTRVALKMTVHGWGDAFYVRG